MRYLKQYKLYEDGQQKPVKKFPTDKAVHLNYLYRVVEEAGLNPYELQKGNRDSSLSKFFFEKCSKENIIFPEVKEVDTWEDSDARYEKFIFKESVFLIPDTYDPKDDYADFVLHKASWIEKMKDMMKGIYKTPEEMDKFEDELEKNVKFGNKDWSWILPALDIIKKKFGQYYKNGKLRIWMPADRDYDPWIGYDYPHKYNIVGHLDHPDGVYFLSDIEKYIYHKYDIKDDLLYQFLIYNQYIEGRYWERIWSFPTEEAETYHLPKDQRGSRNKLQKSNFGKYGMEPTENITHILNIIEREFEINGTDYEGFPVYVDYYKKIKSKY